MVSPGTPVNIFVQQKKLIIPVIMSFQGPPDVHFIRILITDARRTSQVVHEQRYSRFDPDVRLELPVFPPARIEVYDNGILVKEASY
ncbi:MAG: hypothetical protein HYY09_08045 [Firmicutes bacterium]|nr:hypothetical protein [Bacillota bacterium]